jgi:hypothetical protein
MPRADVRHFLDAIARERPNAETELVFTDSYTLLVAVVLSAQATDLSVNKATGPLFAEAPDPKAMVALGVEGVGRHIRSIGLWQGKAKNVVALSQILLDTHGGEVPNDREALEALPGVGRKTANVVLNVAFGQAPWQSTPIFSGSATAPASPPAKPRARWRTAFSNVFRKTCCGRRITGSSCTGAISAAPANPNAIAASPPNGAALNRRPHSPSRVIKTEESKLSFF